MISPGVQASVSRILILVGLALFTYGASTYVAWRHCDERYGTFLMAVDSSIQLRELLRTKDMISWVGSVHTAPVDICFLDGLRWVQSRSPDSCSSLSGATGGWICDATGL